MNKQDAEKNQLREFKMTTLTPGWSHCESLLFIQREAIIKRLIEANRDKTATRDTETSIIGELAGIEMAWDIVQRLLRRYDEESKEEFEKEKSNNG